MKKMKTIIMTVFIFILAFMTTTYCLLPTSISSFSPFDSITQTLYSQGLSPVYFNHTLLTSMETHFFKNLSQALQIYSNNHANHLQHLPIIQYSFKRWLGADVNILDYLIDNTRQGFLERELYQDYNGDVLASLGKVPSLSAFFPRNFSLARYERTVKPSQVSTLFISSGFKFVF
jgi:hypothetical protein